MKLTITYYYHPYINNHMVCVVYDDKGKELAKGYHSRLFKEAKWNALREAQRLSNIEPVIIPETEYIDATW